MLLIVTYKFSDIDYSDIPRSQDDRTKYIVFPIVENKVPEGNVWGIAVLNNGIIKSDKVRMTPSQRDIFSNLLKDKERFLL